MYMGSKLLVRESEVSFNLITGIFLFQYLISETRDQKDLTHYKTIKFYKKKKSEIIHILSVNLLLYDQNVKNLIKYYLNK